MAETTLTAHDRRGAHRAAPRLRGRRPFGHQREGGDQPKAAPAGPAHWQRWAACREMPKNVFFPGGTSQNTRIKEERAKVICATCPVRARCLEFAIEGDEPFGVWGGLNTEERRQLLQQGVVAVAAPLATERTG